MRGLEHLHPQTRKKAERLLSLCREAGLPVAITETLRTAAEQDNLYAQGRTKPGKVVTQARGHDFQSGHQWGVAFDFCRNVRGAEWDESDGFFARAGELGKSVGLRWGGDFRDFKDPSHFEDIDFMTTPSTKALKERYGTPEAFRESWETQCL